MLQALQALSSLCYRDSFMVGEKRNSYLEPRQLCWYMTYRFIANRTSQWNRGILPLWMYFFLLENGLQIQLRNWIDYLVLTTNWRKMWAGALVFIYLGTFYLVVIANWYATQFIPFLRIECIFSYLPIGFLHLPWFMFMSSILQSKGDLETGLRNRCRNGLIFQELGI